MINVIINIIFAVVARFNQVGMFEIRAELFLQK